MEVLVYYETIQWDLNRRLIYECRCDERLKSTDEVTQEKGNIFLVTQLPVMVENTIPGTSKGTCCHVFRTYPEPRICVSDRQWIIFICKSKRDGGKRDVVSVVLEVIVVVFIYTDGTRLCLLLWIDKVRVREKTYHCFHVCWMFIFWEKERMEKQKPE